MSTTGSTTSTSTTTAGGSETPLDTGTTGIEEGGIFTGTWGTSPQLTEPDNNPPAPGLANNTLRQFIFTSIAGNDLRLQISNEFGNGPVTLNSVHLAAVTTVPAIDPATDVTLQFTGSPSVTIPAGQAIYSDEFSFALPELTSVAITIEFGAVPSGITGHPGSRTTSYISTGANATAATLPGAATTDHWYYITRLEVVRAESGVVVTLGDSITDGRGTTTNGNDRWPDALSRRLRGNVPTERVGVINAGIGGNAVVTGGLGPTAIARFDRDALGQANVRWVIVLEGVNDIGGATGQAVATNLINAYQGFITDAHAAGLLIYGVPILPFAGSTYDSADHQQARTTVNNWIRSNAGGFDAIIDLDAAVRNPQNQNQLLPAYDSGDGLHLNPDGYQAMADAIPLELLVP